METESKSSLFFIQNEDSPISHGFPPRNKKMKNKITGPMQLIKIALYMITKKSSKGKPSSSAAAKWKKLLGLVRPLHVESRNQLPSSSPPPVPCIEVPQRDPEGDRGLESPSPAAAMTPYASADNLMELDQPEENNQEEENDNYYDGIEGDEMIDTKAEEFIARFYRQMRLQDETPTDVVT
ncbi:hypothetical protein LINGRAHAP2_LOCUS15954 [Linum grandiflorum]